MTSPRKDIPVSLLSSNAKCSQVFISYHTEMINDDNN